MTDAFFVLWLFLSFNFYLHFGSVAVSTGTLKIVDLSSGASQASLCGCSVCACVVSSVCPGFLPQSKNMHCRFIGSSKSVNLSVNTGESIQKYDWCVVLGVCLCWLNIFICCYYHQLMRLSVCTSLRLRPRGAAVPLVHKECMRVLAYMGINFLSMFPDFKIEVINSVSSEAAEQGINLQNKNVNVHK